MGVLVLSSPRVGYLLLLHDVLFTPRSTSYAWGQKEEEEGFEKTVFRVGLLVLLVLGGLPSAAAVPGAVAVPGAAAVPADSATLLLSQQVWAVWRLPPSTSLVARVLERTPKMTPQPLGWQRRRGANG